MNEEAANKILKILEEPWEKTLFLLISEQPERLLPTIIFGQPDQHGLIVGFEALERKFADDVVGFARGDHALEGLAHDCKQIAALAHPDLHLVFPVNKQGKKSGEVMRSDEFLPLFRGLFAERGGYFSAQDWYDRSSKILRILLAASSFIASGSQISMVL